jgi:hypothetical protein
MSPKKLLLAGAGYLVLSLIYTYPMIRDIGRANRFDSPDAQFNAWTLSWDLHQLGNEPFSVFDANIFYPERGTLAYSENLLVAALMVAPFRLLSDNPILLLNLALLAALTTSGVASFVLTRYLTGNTWAAVTAGLLFAFAPYRWAHVPHLQLQLAFALPLSFYFTHRLFAEGGAKSAVGLGLSIAAAFGSSGYYGIFLLTALPIVIGFELVRGSNEARIRGVRVLALAALVAVLSAAPLVLPYAGKLQEGSLRAFETTSSYSAGAREYLSSFSRLHFFLPKAEEPLFPGFVACSLALLALTMLGAVPCQSASGTKRRGVVWIYAAVGVLGIVLSLGPSGGLFTVLFRVLPPYQGLRVPSRAAILFLFAVSVLAAIGLSRIKQKLIRNTLIAFVAMECYAGPLPWSFEAPVLPKIYEEVASLSEPGALVELPLPPPERFQDNARYVYRSTVHWRPLVNGYSGFVPPSYRRAFERLMRGDFSDGLEELSAEGVRFALVHTSRLGPRMRRQIRASVDTGQLNKISEIGEDRLYRIREPAEKKALGITEDR